MLLKGLNIGQFDYNYKLWTGNSDRGHGIYNWKIIIFDIALKSIKIIIAFNMT